MIEASLESRILQGGAALQDVAASFEWHVRVESWYDGGLLHDDAPITEGTLTEDRTATVPERLSITVPAEVDGFSWSPIGDDLHPLAANGQRLRVSLGVGIAAGKIEWSQRGEYLIDKATLDGDTVRVEALGLLALVAEARLVSPYQPSGTFKSTLRGLVEPALTVVFDAALTDRAVPAGINYDEDRLGAVQEVLNAWPAEMRVTGDGYLYVHAPLTPNVTDSVQGFIDFVIDTGGDSDRDGAINCVVARGQAADGAQVQGVAYDYSTGPHRFGGPFNPLPVPEFLFSPLLTTKAQCVAAAKTRLAKLRRERRLPLRVTAPPLTYVQAGDVVTAGETSATYIVCVIEALSLPLVPGSGSAMDLVLSGDPDD